MIFNYSHILRYANDQLGTLLGDVECKEGGVVGGEIELFSCYSSSSCDVTVKNILLICANDDPLKVTPTLKTNRFEFHSFLIEYELVDRAQFKYIVIF